MNATVDITSSFTPDRTAGGCDPILSGLAAQARARTPLPYDRGMRFVFPATAARLREIDAVARRERERCSFLAFDVAVAPGGAWLTLDVSGPAGTGEFLETLLETRATA